MSFSGRTLLNGVNISCSSWRPCVLVVCRGLVVSEVKNYMAGMKMDIREVGVWTGSNWLRIGTGGGNVWMR